MGTERLRSALAGRYRIERELGGGGMSRVYLAQETALGREVVVKVIASDVAEGLSAERFARERTSIDSRQRQLEAQAQMPVGRAVERDPDSALADISASDPDR